MTSDITNLLKEAWNSYDLEYDDNQLMAYCEQILTLEPNHAEALCLMSRTRFLSDNFEEVDRLLNRAFQYHPDSAVPYATRAYFNMQKKNFAAAKQDFDKAIQMDPGNPRFYFDRANIAFQNSDHNGSIDDLNAAIRLDPNFTAAYHNRGVEYAIAGDLKAALKDQNEAIRCYEKYALSYYSRGRIYINIGKPELALTEFQKAILFGLKQRSSLRYLTHYFAGKGDILKSLALAARAYQDDIEHYLSDDLDTQNFNDAIVEHYRSHLKTRLQRCGDSFVQYWQVRIRWGRQVGPDTFFTGQYGYGYLILARYNLWLVNLKGIHAADHSTKSLLEKAVQTFEVNEIPDDFFQKDRIFLIPHINIRSLENGINPHSFFLNTGSHNWEIPPHDDGQGHSLEDEISSVDFNSQSWEINPYFESDVEQVRAALELAQKRQVQQLFAPLEDIFSQL